MTEKNYSAQLLALQVLMLPAILLSISAVLFFLTIPITPAHFLAALAATVGISFLLFKKHRHFKSPGNLKTCDYWKVTAVFFILILVGLLIGMSVYDFSQDGQAYQQPAVIALANGWNPFHEPFLEKYEPFYKQAMAGNEMYANHYTKASWITAAAVYRLTGSVESGKLFNFLYMAAVFLITWNFLFHFGRIPGKAKLVIAVLTALNPVVLYQVFSYYNDCQLASLLSITLILAFEYILFREEKALFFLFITLPVLSNIKFTGLIYGAVIICLAWLVVFILDRDVQRRFIFTMGAAFLAAVFIIGFQPYMTNLASKGNPFYPALRSGGTGETLFKTVIGNQAPGDFMTKDRFRKLFYSLFSRSDSNLTHMPRLKIPFTIHKNELAAFDVPDARYGGFGPLFGSILLLVIPGAFVVLFKAKRIVKWFGFIPAGVIVVSTLINPEAWWARLSPQLWLLPITLIVSFYYLPGKRWKYGRGLAILLLLVNSMMVIIEHTGYTLGVNRQFKRQMAVLSEATRQTREVLAVAPDVFYLTIHERLHYFKIRHRMATGAGANIQAVGGFPGTPNTKIWFENAPGI